ncbi:hypothetical protein CRYUN_Cryun05aG0032200 [Craigia yunnanensis]
MAACFVKRFLEDYNNAQVKNNLISRVISSHWKPPAYNRYKVNFDGAYDKRSKKGGIGVIIRNYEGAVMGTHVGHKSGMMDAFMVEANAAISALNFAKSMGFQDAELEGDALCIIKIMKGYVDDLSIVSNLIEEAKCTSLSFQSCIVMYGGRDKKKVEDRLANYGLEL